MWSFSGFARPSVSGVALSILLFVTPTGQAGPIPIKVGGQPFVPKGLIFAEPDRASRVFGEGAFSDGCEWILDGAVRVATYRVEKTSPEEDCLRYFYKTTVELQRRCPAPAKPETVSSERTTAKPQVCPDSTGTTAPPDTEARAVSDGTTPDGNRQQIVVLPDGTRLTIQWNLESISVKTRYPDGTTDSLIQKSSPKEE